MLILKWCETQIMCLLIMAYVGIARNLRKNKKYRNLITRDYMNNLAQAAPIHNIEWARDGF